MELATRTGIGLFTSGRDTWGLARRLARLGFKKGLPARPRGGAAFGPPRPLQAERGIRPMPSLALLLDSSSLPGDPADLIPVLQRVHSTYGYISQDSLRRISRWLKISENEIYGVATFFAQFGSPSRASTRSRSVWAPPAT